MSDQKLQEEGVKPISAPRKSRAFDGIYLVCGWGLAVALVIVSLLPLENIARGAILLALMFVLLVLRLHIGLAMLIPGLLGVWEILGIRGFINMASTAPYSQVASFSLSVIPSFILMGLLLWRSGLTNDLYNAARVWLRRLPGGLAVTTNVAGAGLATASGSTMGIAFATGRIGIPEMLRSGYNPKLATGAVVSAGTIGQLIPPSILLVVYATYAEIPVGPQLLAGVVPGVLLLLAYCALIITISSLRPSMAPREGGKSTWKERLRVLPPVIPLVIVVLIVIGGMASGVFTATEAGGMGAFVAALFMLLRVRGKAFFSGLFKAMSETLVALGTIMFLLVGAFLLNRMLAATGLAQKISELLANANVGPFGFVVLMVLLFLVLGTFMDALPIILVLVPILLPVVVEMGFSPMWFGVFVVLMAEIGLMTPPVGMLAFVVHRISQDPEVNLGHKITLGTVFKGALMFIPAALAVIALFSWFPGLVEWLPGLSGGSD